MSKSVKMKKACDYLCSYSGKCLFLLLVILVTVGLWPFNFFANNLVTIGSDRGVHLERPATAYTSVPSVKLRNLTAFTIAIRLATNSSGLSSFEKILSYALSQKEANFILGQWKDGLGLDLRVDGTSPEIHFGEYGVLKKDVRICCVISYDGQALTLYENGRIRKTRNDSLKFSEWVDKYPLVIGTDANGRSQWRGTIYEIAIFDRALTEPEIRQLSEHNKGNRWQVTGDRKAVTTGTRSEIGGSYDRAQDDNSMIEYRGKTGLPRFAHNNETMSDSGPLIHYIFDQANTYETTFRGRKALGVRDLAKGAPADLVIPKYFMPYRRAFLERPSMDLKDYRRNIIEDILINLIGFAPLGMLLFIIFGRKNIGMGVCLFLAAAVGFAVSITIEVLQAFLPSRNSSMLDLIMNTTGTLIGALIMAVTVRVTDYMGTGNRAEKSNKQQSTSSKAIARLSIWFA